MTSSAFPARCFYVSDGVVVASAWDGVHADLQTRRATVFATDDGAATNALTISGGIRLDVNRARQARGKGRATRLSHRASAWRGSSTGRAAQLQS